MRQTATNIVGHWYYPLDPHEADEVDSVSESSTVTAIPAHSKSNLCTSHKDHRHDEVRFTTDSDQIPYSRPQKSVRFDPNVTIYDKSLSPLAVEGTNLDTLWYSREDILSFRQDVQRHVAMLAGSRPEQDVAATLWIEAVYQAYRESAHKIPPKPALPNHGHDTDFGPSLDEFIGLESWFPRPVQRDRQQRYLAAQQVVLGGKQRHRASSPSSHESSGRRLSRASQVVSHPSRLFAQYMAQLVVGSSSNEDDT